MSEHCDSCGEPHGGNRCPYEKVRSLGDARAAKAEEHAAKVRKLFEEHPECAREAVIIWPQGEVTLAPEHLSTFTLLGMLEAAKFGICVQSMKEMADDD